MPDNSNRPPQWPDGEVNVPSYYRPQMRDESLVRAELVESMRLMGDIFEEKAAMELERVDWWRAQAEKMASNAPFGPETLQSAGNFEQRYQILAMRQQETWMRIQRLTLEAQEALKNGEDENQS